MKFYTLDGHRPVAVENVIEWARWSATSDNRVAIDEINGLKISTVFLGVDHNWGGGAPILFETMVFGKSEEWNDYQERYYNWDAAEAGHKRICEAIRNGDSP